MTVFVVVDEPYHENGSVVGVFSDLEKAMAACTPHSSRDEGWSIYEVELDGPVVQQMSDAIRGAGIEPPQIWFR